VTCLTMAGAFGPVRNAVPAAYALRALGGVAHHQDRLAQRGGLLLDPARVSQHQPAMRHQRHEVPITLRRDEADVWQATQQPLDVHQHVRVEVNRVDETVVREALCQRRDRLADLLYALPEVLAAVPGDEHHRQLCPVSAQEETQLLVNMRARNVASPSWVATPQCAGRR